MSFWSILEYGDFGRYLWDHFTARSSWGLVFQRGFDSSPNIVTLDFGQFQSALHPLLLCSISKPATSKFETQGRFGTRRNVNIWFSSPDPIGFYRIHVDSSKAFWTCSEAMASTGSRQPRHFRRARNVHGVHGLVMVGLCGTILLFCESYASSASCFAKGPICPWRVHGEQIRTEKLATSALRRDVLLGTSGALSQAEVQQLKPICEVPLHRLKPINGQLGGQFASISAFLGENQSNSCWTQVFLKGWWLLPWPRDWSYRA